MVGNTEFVKVWRRQRTPTWSCAPARSRTLSVLNLRPSERYASAALSSIPISLHRNDSRLPSLHARRSARHERAGYAYAAGYLSMSQRDAFVCSHLVSDVVGYPRRTIPGILHRPRLDIFVSYCEGDEKWWLAKSHWHALLRVCHLWSVCP